MRRGFQCTRHQARTNTHKRAHAHVSNSDSFDDGTHQCALPVHQGSFRMLLRTVKHPHPSPSHFPVYQTPGMFSSGPFDALRSIPNSLSLVSALSQSTRAIFDCACVQRVSLCAAHQAPTSTQKRADSHVFHSKSSDAWCSVYNSLSCLVHC